jgi:ABC-type lipoprotein release transport system permease subunit
MKTFQFAARNLLRNKRRSALAATSVFLSILMVIVLQGFTNGFLDSMVRNYIKNETGHINIATNGYRERTRFMPVDEYIENSSALAESIRTAIAVKDPGVIVAERIRFGVLLSSASGTKDALAIAGDPEVERRLLMLDTRILPGGTYMDGIGETIVGETLAYDLGLKVGDTLKVVTQKADGGLGFRKLKISGFFKTGVNSLDGIVFQMSLADARILLGMEDGAQQISVTLSGMRNVAAVTALVSGIAATHDQGSLSVLPWTAIGEYPKMIQLMSLVYYWVFLIVSLLGSFIIANVMTMVILERKREIGILMSMGMPKRRILNLFLAEGTMLGLVGSVTGTVIGIGFIMVLARKGFDMTSAMKGFSWPLDNVIYPSVTPGTIFLGIVMGTAVSAAISYLPSRRAARMAPADAIKSV